MCTKISITTTEIATVAIVAVIIRPARSCFLILFLKELRLGKLLKSLLSFDRRNGPKNLLSIFHNKPY